MEKFMTSEVEAVEVATSGMVELGDLQLALVGGGIGEIVL